MTMTRTYDFSDDGGSTASEEADSLDEARDLAREWALDGDWGNNGALVTVYLACEGEDMGWIEVAIPADDEALQRDAGVDPTCDHDWGTIEVQSLGGTTIASTDMCALCGATCHAVSYGHQRNPGQVDEVSYQPGEEVAR